MLEKLILHNFQSHKHSELDFDPGVNVIVGPSDSGKTALIRALRWLVWGRPLGDSFIRHGRPLCRVSVEIDGTPVIREKTKGGETSYQFQDRGYTALRTEVPEQIRSFLNLGETNLQQQLDRPFLLDSSPGEVAQHFNRVAHLDQIDFGMKNILSWTRKLNQTFLNKGEQLKELESSLEKYEYLEDAEARITVIESAQTKLNGLQNQKEQILKNLAQVEEIEKTQKEYLPKVKLEKRVNSILSMIAETSQKKTDMESLLQRIDNYQAQETRIKRNQKLEALGSRVESVLSLLEEVRKRKTKKGQLHSMIQNVLQSSSDFKTQSQKVTSLEGWFKENFPDVCPLCGQKVRNA